MHRTRSRLSLAVIGDHPQFSASAPTATANQTWNRVEQSRCDVQECVCGLEPKNTKAFKGIPDDAPSMRSSGNWLLNDNFGNAPSRHPRCMVAAQRRVEESFGLSKE